MWARKAGLRGWKTYALTSKKIFYFPIFNSSLNLCAWAKTASLSLVKVNIARCVVPVTDIVKIQGVTINRHLTFDTHMYRTYVSLPTITYGLWSTFDRHFLLTWRGLLLLDYVNSVLYGTSAGDMLQVQQVQNSLACVVTNTKRVEHIHPVYFKN